MTAADGALVREKDLDLRVDLLIHMVYFQIYEMGKGVCLISGSARWHWMW